MPIGSDTFAYRRHLPHLVNADKTYFVTFRTIRRFQLEPTARSAVLEACVELHKVVCWLDCITVMPDHIHMIFKPLDVAVSEVMKRLKGRSARRVNLSIGRSGPLWQHESFDHILRSGESLHAKMEYVCNNPVRAGLAGRWQDYPWTWRACDH
ncbi:MAG TPA: transposase [Thermoanaerobaculia bacterium]|nr:transposase [Thermoanaerobaculia bacterium]